VIGSFTTLLAVFLCTLCWAQLGYRADTHRRLARGDTWKLMMKKDKVGSRKPKECTLTHTYDNLQEFRIYHGWWSAGKSITKKGEKCKITEIMEHDYDNNRVKFRFKCDRWSVTGMRNRWVYYLEGQGQDFIEWAFAHKDISNPQKYKAKDCIRKKPPSFQNYVLGYRVKLLKDKIGYQTVKSTNTVSLNVNMDSYGDNAKIENMEVPNWFSWINEGDVNFNCCFAITKISDCVVTSQENKVLLETKAAGKTKDNLDYSGLKWQTENHAPENRWLYFDDDDAPDGTEFLFFLLNKMPQKFDPIAKATTIAFFEERAKIQCGKLDKDNKGTPKLPHIVEDGNVLKCKYPAASGMKSFDLPFRKPAAATIPTTTRQTSGMTTSGKEYSVTFNQKTLGLSLNDSHNKVFVESVGPNSEAQRNGVVVGNQVLLVNGAKASTTSSVYQRVQNAPRPITIVFKRP